MDYKTLGNTGLLVSRLCFGTMTFGGEGMYKVIGSVDQNPAPKRLVLGGDSYTMIQKALTERLAAVEAQKDLAFSTDFPKEA